MASVFRIATMQAIKEIVEECSVAGRFGLIVTEENLEDISNKVVDLFEMTLELRAKTQDMFGQMSSQKEAPQKRSREEQGAPFPKTRNAAEVYSYGERNSSPSYDAPIVPHLDAKLPRKRFELSLEEKERIMRR